MLSFTATPYTINSWLIIRLPQAVSQKLPSRGQVMVKGTINGHHFQTALEPDGNGSHWLNVDKAMQDAAHISTNVPAELAVESTKDWPEPPVPNDVQAALKKSPPQIQTLWKDITPMARWEWVRWINSTAQAQTRLRRIEVAISKMSKGERRPCCFNRNMCCVPQVAKSGVLLEPART